MTSLGWNVGSLAEHVYNQVDGIPDSISGTMIDLAKMAMIRVENMTDKVLDVNNLDDVCIPALKCFTMSQLLSAMHSQGVKSSNVRIGDFSIGKGQDLLKAAEDWENMGINKIYREVGMKVNFYKSNG